MTSRLLLRTLELLQERPYSLPLTRISAETSIPYGWLSMLQRGQISEPSVVRIEQLYEYLSGTKLIIK